MVIPCGNPHVKKFVVDVLDIAGIERTLIYVQRINNVDLRKATRGKEEMNNKATKRKQRLLT